MTGKAYLVHDDKLRDLRVDLLADDHLPDCVTGEPNPQEGRSALQRASGLPSMKTKALLSPGRPKTVKGDPAVTNFG